MFTDAYKLPALAEIEKHIKEKGHLPEIQSAAEVERNGVNLGEINAQLLKKIEELTLYLIQENKINVKNTQRLEAQELQIRLLIDKLDSFNGARAKN